MIGTQYASASTGTRRAEIHQLRLRRAGIPISSSTLHENDIDQKPTVPHNPESQSRPDEASQLIELGHPTQDSPIAAAQSDNTTKSEQETQSQSSKDSKNGVHLLDLPIPSITQPSPDEVHEITPQPDRNHTTDIIGVSILGAAVLFHYASDLFQHASDLLHLVVVLPVSWTYSLLPDIPPPQQQTYQLRFTLFFLSTPILAALTRIVIGVLRFIFLLIEDNALKRGLQTCEEIMAYLEMVNRMEREKLRLMKRKVEQDRKLRVLEEENTRLKKIHDERG
ncbi:MAG: hypothetical protein L6R40_004851 [Gallowayella cf. fulva]|nr:MAG: hypothetical protein L6R40_004851 [Xanthomendoza cf. fulva]